MVLRVVSTTIRQSSQCSKWLVSSSASAGSSSPSKNSESFRITSLQTTVQSFLKALVQPLPQSQPRSQQTRLYRGNRHSEHRRRFFRGKVLHVSQDEDDAELGLQFLQGLGQDLL